MQTFAPISHECTQPVSVWSSHVLSYYANIYTSMSEFLESAVFIMTRSEQSDFAGINFHVFSDINSHFWTIRITCGNIMNNSDYI